MRNFYEFSSFQSNPDFKITAGNCTRLFSPLFAFPTISIDTKEYETLLKKSFYICTYLIALEQLISTEIPPRVILPNGKMEIRPLQLRFTTHLRHRHACAWD